MSKPLVWIGPSIATLLFLGTSWGALVALPAAPGGSSLTPFGERAAGPGQAPGNGAELPPDGSPPLGELEIRYAADASARTQFSATGKVTLTVPAGPSVSTASTCVSSCSRKIVVEGTSDPLYAPGQDYWVIVDAANNATTFGGYITSIAFEGSIQGEPSSAALLLLTDEGVFGSVTITDATSLVVTHYSFDVNETGPASSPLVQVVRMSQRDSLPMEVPEPDFPPSEADPYPILPGEPGDELASVLSEGFPSQPVAEEGGAVPGAPSVPSMLRGHGGNDPICSHVPTSHVQLDATEGFSDHYPLTWDGRIDNALHLARPAFRGDDAGPCIRLERLALRVVLKLPSGVAIPDDHTCGHGRTARTDYSDFLTTHLTGADAYQIWINGDLIDPWDCYGIANSDSVGSGASAASVAEGTDQHFWDGYDGDEMDDRGPLMAHELGHIYGEENHPGACAGYWNCNVMKTNVNFDRYGIPIWFTAHSKCEIWERFVNHRAC